jgi:hypothetical protein
MKRPICSICLDRVTIIPFSRLSKFLHIQKSQKLLCGHIFHDECVKKLYKLKCPLCSHPILSEDDKMLLKAYLNKSYSLSYIIYLLKLSNINVNTVYTVCMKKERKYRDLINLMYIYCDFTQVLFENIRNYDLVNALLTNKANINWFKTFGGRTFFDLVLGIDDTRIANIVFNNTCSTSAYEALRREVSNSISSLYFPFQPSAPSSVL